MSFLIFFTFGGALSVLSAPAEDWPYDAGETLDPGCSYTEGTCVVTISGGEVAGSVGEIQFNNGADAFGSSSSFLYDSINNRLGLNRNIAGLEATLHIMVGTTLVDAGSDGVPGTPAVPGTIGDVSYEGDSGDVDAETVAFGVVDEEIGYDGDDECTIATRVYDTAPGNGQTFDRFEWGFLSGPCSGGGDGGEIDPGVPYTLAYGLTVTFPSGTGHTAMQIWQADLTPGEDEIPGIPSVDPTYGPGDDPFRITSWDGANTLFNINGNGEVVIKSAEGYNPFRIYSWDGTERLFNVADDGKITLANVEYTFPDSQGTDGYVLTANGGGILTWEAVGGGDSLFTLDDKGNLSDNRGGNETMIFDANNISLGINAGVSNMTGLSNIFIGTSAGTNNSSGSYNIFSGYNAGNASTTASDSIFIGKNAGYSNTTMSYNVGIGSGSLELNSSGAANTALGYHTLTKNETGNYNTAVGSESLSENIGGSRNTALGLYSLWKNTTGSYNTALGAAALALNTTGVSNIAIGDSALSANETGAHNTAVGYRAGMTNIGDYNVFTGDDTGYSNTTGGGNTFVGAAAGYSNISGSDNVFLGRIAGFSNTSGVRNAFTGYESGYNNTTGEGNVFNGYFSGYSNTTGTGNVFIGAQAAQANTTGYDNVFIGDLVAQSNTTGFSNVFSGAAAGQFNTTGSNNVFSGALSGRSNTTGAGNTFSGYGSGYSNSTGHHNVFSGQDAGYSNTTGYYNVFSGIEAGYNNTSGIYNIFSGMEAGFSNTTGQFNIAIGGQAGFANTTGSYNTMLGLGADVASGTISHSIALGAEAIATQNNEFALPDSIDYWRFNDTSYTLPTADGDADDVLTTDGNGVMTWEAAGGGGTLDEAYDFGGAGSGRTIIADSGAVKIAGEDGFQITGTFGSGDAIDLSGAGERMFFNPAKAAFRAGGINSTQWDDVNVGAYSIGLGANSLSSGLASFTAGYGNTASQSYAVAMGQENSAPGQAGIALGYSNIASTFGVALGYDNTTGGDDGYYWTLGAYNQLTKNASFAIGIGNTINGRNSGAFGSGTTASSAYEYTFGRLNTLYTANAVNTWDDADRLFVIGNGSVSPSDAFTILKNGETGIGIDNFEANTNGNIFQVGDGTTGVIGWVDDGTGDWTTTSDERLKDNIEDINYGLNELLQLRPVQYDFKRNGEHAIGFIAQEVMPIIPDVVSGDEDQYGIAYQAFAPVIVKAIQELDLKITDIETMENQSFKDYIISWFADAANGIQSFFASEIHTDQICVKKSNGNEVCVTGDQLEEALGGVVEEEPVPEPIEEPTEEPSDELVDEPAGGEEDDIEEITEEETVVEDEVLDEEVVEEENPLVEEVI